VITHRTIRVGPEHAGERLDAFVANVIPTTSRPLVERAIEKRWLMVDGQWRKKGRKLEEGNVVAIERLMEDADWRAVPNPAVVVPVLHKEAAFLVVDKPAGMPVHPLDPDETDTIVNGLLAACPELAGVGPDPLFPAVAHRLDAETSGVMLVARDAKTYDYLRRQFKERKIAKKYIALVCGQIDGAGRLEHHLAHSFGGAHRMVVADDPGRHAGRKPMLAVTEYSVRERLARHTLLDVVIRTGVTHQIRCQLAHVGHPIAGDALYGSPDADAGYHGRLFLHAAEIAFRDPATGEPRVFQSHQPADLQAAQAALRP
jgi:23S rRNA pseudouridine1911/1915/1917 synthase